MYILNMGAFVLCGRSMRKLWNTSGGCWRLSQTTHRLWSWRNSSTKLCRKVSGLLGGELPPLFSTVGIQEEGIGTSNCYCLVRSNGILKYCQYFSSRQQEYCGDGRTVRQWRRTRVESCHQYLWSNWAGCRGGSSSSSKGWEEICWIFSRSPWLPWQQAFHRLQSKDLSLQEDAFVFSADGLVGMAIVGGMALGVAGLAGLIGLAVSKSKS